MNLEKVSLLIFTLSCLCLIECCGQANTSPRSMPYQVSEPVYQEYFKVPAPSTPTIEFDTSSTRWSDEPIHILSKTDGINWATTLEGRQFGNMVRSDHYFYSVSTDYQYTNGNQSSCDLIVDVLNMKGSSIASSRKSNIKGFSILSMVAKTDHAYFMFQEELSPSDRDLYIAKVDTIATILWTTQIGKRFGTFGQRLLQIHPNGDLIALTSHYDPLFVDVLDSNTGVIKKSQRLDFGYGLNPESFVINQAQHVTAIATQYYYVGTEKFNAILLFELDTNFTVIRQQFFNTDLQDWGQDIIQRPDGNYVFLVNSEFSSQNYKEEFEIHILGITNPNFQLLEQKAIEIIDDGMDSQLCLNKKDTYLFQRSAKGFNLLVLNAELQIQKAYTNEEGYRNPVFMTIGHNDEVWIGGNGVNTWIAEMGI